MDINTLINFFNWFLNHLLVFTNLGTLILTIILATKNQYQPFIETKHQQILNDILFPFYETIELQLFQPITEENKVLKLQQINQFIQHTRKHQLFYLLGSKLTSIVGAGVSFLIYIASLLIFLLLKRINDHFKKRTKGITKSN